MVPAALKTRVAALLGPKGYLDRPADLVQPGVVNLDVTLAVESRGYFYAPDPSSQRAG